MHHHFLTSLGRLGAVLLLALGVAVPAAADSVPLPPERPDHIRSKSASSAWQLPPVVDDDVAEETRQAVRHLLANRFDDALAVQRELSDPLAVKLIEFLYIREAGGQVPHSRIARFLEASPDWPWQDQLRRRLEVALLSQRADNDAVLAAFEAQPPLTNPGAILHAGALAATGEERRASDLIRELWRNANLTDGEERLIRQRFGQYIEEADLRHRLERLLYSGNRVAAMRLARELGGDDLKLAEARIAVLNEPARAGRVLDEVPERLHEHPVYVLSRIQYERRTGDRLKAARMLLEAPEDSDLLADPDVWASERRIAARALAEAGEAVEAYKVMRGHAAKASIERMDSEWHAGWIALSFLDDAETATPHFAALREIAGRPISIARAEYWSGRAAEARGDEDEALVHYRAAAAHATTYYGQLALNRIAATDVPALRKPLHADAARRLVQEREPMQALRLLVQTGHESLAANLMMRMAESTDDGVTLIGLAEIVHRLGLADAAVQIGKQGLYAGHPTETYAFPRLGIPDYNAVGPHVEPALVYAIARQESLFNPRAGSHAGALGLMQLMPGTARQTAETYGLAYSQTRLTADPVYNVVLGAAHLGELVARYGDAYALVFAAYNAGGSRVRQWLERFGDPRTGEIDPVDWVELIPFTETRNYVQRVMEGLQVYRAALEGGGPLLIARDLRLPDGGLGDLEIAREEGPFDPVTDAPLVDAPPVTGLGFAPSPSPSPAPAPAPAPAFGSGGGGSTGFGFGGGN